MSLSQNISRDDSTPDLLAELSDEQRLRLTSILDDYLIALEHGQPLDSAEIVAQHADLAQPLTMYFASLETLHQVAVGFQASPGATPGEILELDQQLGDFRLLRELGRGGMGVVYEAEQLSLRRRVALKVLPFASVLDQKHIARFKNEAQAAGQLCHPHIVPVIAVGQEQGVHYYAMQLIAGQSLDIVIADLREQLDQAVNAPTDTSCGFLQRRLASRRDYFLAVAELGRQAAEALHAAHERGIVHRDIKPSNLLLEPSGKLWITDFGLARCQQNISLTRSGELVGTLRYMSPEQALGRNILVDRRTDIYSLGAALYELLALRPAFTDDQPQTLLRRLETEEPPVPSRLRRGIPRDLETVVLKAMAKRREDRYPTAAALAADLCAVLSGRPTAAREQTLVSRSNAWLKQHRQQVWMGTTAMVLILVGALAARQFISQRRDVNEERYQQAERGYQSALAAADRFGHRVVDGLAELPANEPLRRQLLTEALQLYQQFAADFGNSPRQQPELAAAYSKISHLHEQLGDIDAALQSQQRAVTIYAALLPEKIASDDTALIASAAAAQANLARLRSDTGDASAAVRGYEYALQLQQRLHTQAPHDISYLASTAATSQALGVMLAQEERFKEAEERLRAAASLRAQQLALGDKSVETQRGLATAEADLADVLCRSDAQRAGALYDQALIRLSKQVAEQGNAPDLRSELAALQRRYAAAMTNGADFAAALLALRKAMETNERLCQDYPSQVRYQQALVVALHELGCTQYQAALPTEAEASLRKALERQQAIVAANVMDNEARAMLAGIWNNLGLAQVALHNEAAAAISFQQAIAQQRSVFERSPTVQKHREQLGREYFNLADVSRHLGRSAEAAEATLRRRELWPHNAEHLSSIADELNLTCAEWVDQPGQAMSASDCAKFAQQAALAASAAASLSSQNLENLAATPTTTKSKSKSKSNIRP